MATMRAVGYTKNGPVDAADALVDFTLPIPEPGARDLRVKVAAVSVNPIDTKQRRNIAPPAGTTRVLGFDAAGVVDAVGSQVRHFKPGDRVFYAGAIQRPGSNAEYQCVDERIVGHMPTTLGFAQAAAVPLTAVTSWELLFDRLQLPRDDASVRLLIIGGGGGVGSLATQLARQLTRAQVITTASRDESRAWSLQLGAHAVLDHRQPLDAQLRAAGIDAVTHVLSTTQTHQHWPAIIEAMAPQGRVALIDDPELFDFRLAKRKSVSIHWESMFTRSMYEPPDMARQHEILEVVAQLLDAGKRRTTLNAELGVIDARNLLAAHAQIESGHTHGKLVLSGFAA